MKNKLYLLIFIIFSIVLTLKIVDSACIIKYSVSTGQAYACSESTTSDILPITDPGDLLSLNSIYYQPSTLTCGSLIIRLSSNSNAHASYGTTTPSTYGYLCFPSTTGTESQAITECSLEPNCTGQKKCLFTLSSLTNAHISTCPGNNIFTNKVCCTVGTSSPPPTTQTFVCGDNICGTDLGEDTTSCPSDCCGSENKIACDLDTSCQWNSTANSNIGACISKTPPPLSTGSACNTIEDNCPPGLKCQVDNPGDAEGICVYKDCIDLGGIPCQSDQLCVNNEVPVISGAGDTAKCCPQLTDPTAFSCGTVLFTLTGDTQIITNSECKNIDANGIGTKTLQYPISAENPNGKTETVPCAVLIKKTNVPVFTGFNVILSILLLSIYYIKRKL